MKLTLLAFVIAAAAMVGSVSGCASVGGGPTRTTIGKGAAMSFTLEGQSSAADEPPPDSVTSPEGVSAPAASAEGDLSAKLQNPVGSVYSVPIETTVDFGAPNGTATFINLQPVIPVEVGENWNLINRTIVPLIDAPGVPAGSPSNPEPQFGPRTFGLGDINHSAFLSPSRPGSVIWGVGPVVSLPTATDPVLGSEKLSAGPTAVVLTQPKPWTVGLLVGNIWSLAGASDRRSINQMFLQYFVNCNLGAGWYLTTTPMITANWLASSEDRWNVPVGGGAGKLWNVGGLPIRTQVQAFSFVEKPTGGADWAMMFTVQFVIPK